jgi:prepilin peptidase CpaA
MSAPTFVPLALLIPLAVIISYYDVRYRRIPNVFVLATLTSGIIINAFFGGLNGALSSLGGCLIGFALMFVMHLFGAMGAGDVKLFAAVSAVVGASLVLPMLAVVVITGGVLAIYSMVNAGTVRETFWRVWQLFLGFLPGWPMPRFSVPADKRHTIPYGVAITIGSLISLAIFRA